MKMKLNSLFISSLSMLFLLLVTPVFALKPGAYISEINGAELLSYKIPLWKKIQFAVKVCVLKDSPVPLDGFTIKIKVKRPDGLWKEFEQTFNDKIPIGECRNYVIKTNIIADKVGTWHYVVSLYTKDKQHKLDEVSGTFEVVGVPKAEVEVMKIVGWAVASSMMVTGLTLALSRIIKG